MRRDRSTIHTGVPLSDRQLVEFDTLPAQLKKKFLFDHVPSIKKALGELFHCNVGVVKNPIGHFRTQYDIDVTQKVHRTLYHPDAQTSLFALALFTDANAVAFLGIILQNITIPLRDTKFLAHVGDRLKGRLQVLYENNFNGTPRHLGPDLVVDAIVAHLSSGIDAWKVRYLLETFCELRTLTFESKPFTTGVIFTPRLETFGKRHGQEKLVWLQKAFELDPVSIRSNRAWFIVDGLSTFYVVSRKLVSFFILLNEKPPGNSLASFYISTALKGRDFSMSTTIQHELVVATAGQEEFALVSAGWRYRDFVAIASSLSAMLPKFDSEALHQLMKIILELVATRTSSLMWIPKESSLLETHTMTYCKVSSEVTLNNRLVVPLLRRVLASDGAIVFSPKGELLGYAAIANLSAEPAAQVGKPRGSGATAAAVLSRHGVVVKVSQDGDATVFLEGKAAWRL